MIDSYSFKDLSKSAEETRISPFSSSAKSAKTLMFSPQSAPKKETGLRFVAASCALKVPNSSVGISKRLILSLYNNSFYLPYFHLISSRKSNFL